MSKSVDPMKASQLAQQLVEILLPEDSEVRIRSISAALALLGEGASIGDIVKSEVGQPASNGRDAEIDMATFFERDGDFKPADYAQLCAAYHFAQFGTAPFTLDEIRSIAASVGLVLPDRVDMTFANAAVKGKKLFQKAGRGAYRPTTMAGIIFRDKWGVKPGRKSKPNSTKVGADNA